MMMTGYLVEPDNPNHWRFEDHVITPRSLPESIDMRPLSMSRRNQAGTQSCVGHATIKALEIAQAHQVGAGNITPLSALQNYYLAREIQTPKMNRSDTGTFISLACDAARRFGVCPESMWPFDPRKVNKSPTWKAMMQAYRYRAAAFYKISSVGDKRVDMVRKALSQKHPVIIGTDIGKSWYDYQAGQVLEPLALSDMAGRHATVLLGYDKDIFYGENSWGSYWGDNGFYQMDASVVASLQTHECWVITASPIL